MVLRFYVDTSVWRDFFEDRSDGVLPLGEFAFRFLQQCQINHCIVLVAEPVFFELKDFSRDWLQGLFSSFGDIVLEVPVFGVQRDEAGRISETRSVPFNDALHAVIARDNKAVLISRDRHFELLSDLADCKASESVIFR